MQNVETQTRNPVINNIYIYIYILINLFILNTSMHMYRITS